MGSVRVGDYRATWSSEIIPFSGSIPCPFPTSGVKRTLRLAVRRRDLRLPADSVWVDITSVVSGSEIMEAEREQERGGGLRLFDTRAGFTWG